MKRPVATPAAVISGQRWVSKRDLLRGSLIRSLKEVLFAARAGFAAEARKPPIKALKGVALVVARAGARLVFDDLAAGCFAAVGRAGWPLEVVRAPAVAVFGTRPRALFANGATLEALARIVDIWRPSRVVVIAKPSLIVVINECAAPFVEESFAVNPRNC